MSLLWVAARRAHSAYAEDHTEHDLHPAFAAAGIVPSRCGFPLCHDVDYDHAEAFDEAERRGFEGKYHPERISLAEPVHGFEHICDLHTLRRYTHEPPTEPALMFRHQGQHHILNGHHRLAAALRRGDSHADVDMIDLDDGTW